MQPLLSICIPTYNRPKSLEKLLQILIPQLDGRTEIVLRDDSTNFYSKEIFEKLVADQPFTAQYFSGEKIGVDAANLLLLEKAKGKYLWWFSDDDTLIDGGIKKVLEIIDSDSDISFIWANFAFEKITNLAIERSDGYFIDRNDVIETLGINIGLLSTYILRVDEARKGLDYGKKHIHGFSFAATAVVLWTLTLPGKFYFMCGPYVLCNPTTIDEIVKLTQKPGGEIVNDGFVTYGVYFHDIVIGLKSHFKYKAVRKILSNNFGSLWRGMIVGWVGGWDTPEGKRLKMLQLYWSYPECWIALFLLNLPHGVVKSLYKFYKLFYSHRKFVFFSNKGFNNSNEN